MAFLNNLNLKDQSLQSKMMWHSSTITLILRLNRNEDVIIVQASIKIKMALNLNKNGSFIERRKMYVEFPFHNLQSSIPIDWNTPEAPSPIKARQSYQQAYIKDVYNQRIDRQIQQKYKAPIDTFRAIPNEITLQKDRDTLSKEVEQFNSSRVISAGNISQKDKIHINSYKPQTEVSDQVQMHIKVQMQKQGLNQSYNTHEYNPQVTEPERYASLSRVNDSASAEKIFNKGFINEYRRYVHQSPHSVEFQPIRNLLPDKLESFLRQHPRENRKSILRASISHARHLANS